MAQLESVSSAYVTSKPNYLARFGLREQFNGGQNITNKPNPVRAPQLNFSTNNEIGETRSPKRYDFMVTAQSHFIFLYQLKKILEAQQNCK